jgi:hypothetical protein
MTGCVVEVRDAGESVDGEQFIDGGDDARSRRIGGVQLGRFIKLSSRMRPTCVRVSPGKGEVM